MSGLLKGALNHSYRDNNSARQPALRARRELGVSSPREMLSLGGQDVCKGSPREPLSELRREYPWDSKSPVAVPTGSLEDKDSISGHKLNPRLSGLLVWDPQGKR